jgi:NTP pyrophosphatase (non-canonical NTP hydrolase)
VERRCAVMDKNCASCSGIKCGTGCCEKHSLWTPHVIDKEIEWNPIDRKAISFPILNNLTPSTHSCTLKVMEEVGELMQKLGKGQGANGERESPLYIDKQKWAVETVCEAIDTAQSAITLADVLCKEYGFDLEELMELHESKLKEKGYLK